MPNIKFILMYLVLSVAFIPISCKKLDKLTQFTMDYQQDFTIQSSTGINLPFNLVAPEMETNSESRFASEDTRKDLIEEIKLTSLRVQLNKPENGDLKFLNEVELFINAEGLDEALIAFKYNIPSSVGKTLQLDVTEADFKEYIKKEEFTLRLRAKTDEVLSRNHELTTFATFFVDAKLIR